MRIEWDNAYKSAWLGIWEWVKQMVAIITIICKLNNSRARTLFLALWICELLSVSAQQGLLSTKTSSWSVWVHPAGNSYHFVKIYCPSQHRIVLLSALLWVSLQGVSMSCVCSRVHTFPCLSLPVSVSLLALRTLLCMHMAYIYYSPTGPKRMSLHTETTAIKTCQTSGREVRGNASETFKWGDEVAEQGCPQVPWSSPPLKGKQLSPMQGKPLLY